MFGELTEELLDLTISEKGFGTALYAVTDPDDTGCSSSCSSCWSLCCTI